MARPRKQNTDVMKNEIVEVKDEGNAHVDEPKMVEVTQIEDKVSELVVEVVKPKTAEPDKTKIPTPICDIAELSDEDKQVLIEKRITSIMSQTQIPFIPALIKYREPGTTAVPPMFALVDFDHRFVDEAWQFYKTNVREPYVKDFLEVIKRVMGKPNRVFVRLVQFNYE